MKTIGIGKQDFAALRESDCFYVDKTSFIREWWESEDDVTLIARPRRFGKTLNMSMLECFFSAKYTDRGDLFEGLSIWESEKYRALQGTYPVIFLSFANVKESDYISARERICRLISEVYNRNWFLIEGDLLRENEKADFLNVTNKKTKMSEEEASTALHNLSGYLYRYYGEKTIILLDEYDTPMQEAYVSGYWNELVSFTRNLFNSTFKTNPYLEKGIMTGITRVSKESIFSDLNNLEVITTTSDKYATSFGFTEAEVFEALDEYGYADRKEEIKYWYDGFTFGSHTDIYNPWSILNFLDKGKIDTYWANTSSNSLVGKLVREGNRKIKTQFEDLLSCKEIRCMVDEQLIYNDFINALLTEDLKAMNAYMNRVALTTFSYFDTGKSPSGPEPERFYHGFVLGLLVDLRDRYEVLSNRESGFGRYDVMIKPKDIQKDDAYILEFKVHDQEDEETLTDTVEAAHKQIEEKKYDAPLLSEGIPAERIHKYGFAFEGKKVLIG